MAGRTPYEAARALMEAMQRWLSCVTPGVVSVAGGYFPSEQPHLLALGPGGQRLRGVPLAIHVRYYYRLTESPENQAAPWVAVMTGYLYRLEHLDEREILAYHWHPATAEVRTPHLHVSVGAQIGFAPLQTA